MYFKDIFLFMVYYIYFLATIYDYYTVLCSIKIKVGLYAEEDFTVFFKVI